MSRHILIELCTDGCFEPVHFIGEYDTLSDAQWAMAERVEEVTATYTKWRGYEFDDEYTDDSSHWVGRGYDGEGYVFEWYIFNSTYDAERVRYGR